METVFLITSWQHLKCREAHCPTCVGNTFILCAYNAVSLACTCSTLCPHVYAASHMPLLWVGSCFEPTVLTTLVPTIMWMVGALVHNRLLDCGGKPRVQLQLLTNGYANAVSVSLVIE